MSDQEDYADNDLPRPWFLRFLLRRFLQISTLVLLTGAAAVALFGGTYSDKHYMTYKTITDAEDVVRTLYAVKDRGGKYPANLTDVKSSDGLKLNDA